MNQLYEVQTRPEPGTPPGDGDQRPIGVIVNDIWEKAETLVRQEMRLGLSEAQEKVDVLKAELDERVRALKQAAVGGAIAMGGSLALVAAIVLLLAQVMWPWLAALITGAVLCIAGLALLRRPAKLATIPNAGELIPERTIKNIKADAHAIEEASHGTAR